MQLGVSSVSLFIVSISVLVGSSFRKALHHYLSPGQPNWRVSVMFNQIIRAPVRKGYIIRIIRRIFHISAKEQILCDPFLDDLIMWWSDLGSKCVFIKIFKKWSQLASKTPPYLELWLIYYGASEKSKCFWLNKIFKLIKFIAKLIMAAWVVCIDLQYPARPQNNNMHKIILQALFKLWRPWSDSASAGETMQTW